MLRTSLFCAVIFSSQLVAKTDSSISIPFIDKPAVIDGGLSEPHWQQAKEFQINNITWPYENQPSPVSTKAYVYEDGESLYVAFIAEDPNPENIRAFYRDRDKAWNDDLVGIKIDSYNNEKLAYQFFINPLGIQMDSIENELTKRESDAWDGIWHSQGKITEQGYVVEVAIPFRILNFEQSNDRKQMALELVRFLPRDERLRLSSIQIAHDNDCWVCQMQTVDGFETAKQGNNLTLVPTLVLGRNEQRDVDGDAIGDWENDNNVEPGLDIKWGITPEITLSATLNPDFSQVEADVAQLSINNNFTLFFPEKRTFFLENADYFSSPWNLIYTRNVAEPDAGIKLTGAQGKHTFGAFVANDNQSNILIPGNLGSTIVSLDDKSENLAARYRYDINTDLSFAATATARTAGDYYNHLTSIDTKYKPTNNDTIIAQIAYSQTKYSDAFRDDLCDEDDCTNISEIDCVDNSDCPINESYLRVASTDAIKDIAYRVSYEHNEKHWSAFARYNNQGADYRADLGFMSRSDFNKFVTGGSYRWYGEADKNWWSRINLYGDWDITHNDNGELLEKEAQANLSADGPWQSHMSMELVTRDRIGLRHNTASLKLDGNTTLFTEDQVQVYLNAKPIAGLFTEVSVLTGDRVDLANNRLGDMIRIRPRLDYNINRHLEFRLRHTYEKMDADNQDLFTANLTDARLSYQFDSRSFIRLALIYTDIERNQANYDDDVTKHYKSLSTQLLYSYKVNPQTVFFAGYSDKGYQDDDLSRITKDNRSVFVKLSYAWMM